jgi:hypothetical protein
MFKSFALCSTLLAVLGCVPDEDGTAPEPTPGPGVIEPEAGVNRLTVSEENMRTVEPDTVRIELVHLEDGPGYLAIQADENGTPGPVLGVERVQPRRRNYVTVTLDAPLNARQRVWAVVYADAANTNQFSTDLPVAPGADGALQTPFDLYFQSTTTVEDSPYYQNPCPFEQWLDDPTDLFVDCRCSPNQVTLSICRSPNSPGQDTRYGDGPSLSDLPFDSRMRGGVVYPATGEVIFGVRWQDENHTSPGTIMAVNYTTGDRRIISGRWKDPNAGYEVFGDGPELAEPIDLELGPDGAIYAWAWRNDTTALDGVTIMRIDLETGARSQVWGINNPAFGQCSNGASNDTQTQFHKYAFTMDAAGNYYVATLKNGLPHSGRGIARISADGSACEYVTMDGVAEGNAFHPGIGEGYPVGQFNYYGLEIHEGALYSLNNGDLIRIDLQTGDRRRISGDGAGPGSKNIAGYYLQYNAEWDLMMASGMPMRPEFVGGVELDTGRVHTFAQCLNIEESNPFATDCFEGAAAPDGRGERQTWVLPNGNWLAAHSRGFALVEPRTGNSYVLSN